MSDSAKSLAFPVQLDGEILMKLNPTSDLEKTMVGAYACRTVDLNDWEEVEEAVREMRSVLGAGREPRNSQEPLPL